MKNKTRSVFARRAACIGLTAVMGATFVAGQVFALTGKGTALNQTIESVNFENVTGKVDLTKIKLENMSNRVVENTSAYSADSKETLIVKLDGNSLAQGGTDEKTIERQHDSFLSELERAGVSYTLKSSYSSVINAVAIEVKLSSVATIRSLEGVAAITANTTYARPKDVDGSDGAQLNYSNIYKNGIYNSKEYVEQGFDGTGMTVAILDTGLDYTHNAFAAANLNDERAVAFTYQDVVDKMDANKFKATSRSGATAADVYVNEKVPFAYDYADNDSDVYPSFSQHGTHVAGIVAGKDDNYTDKNGHSADEEFRGVAPEAQLVICKVFTDNLEDPEIGGAETINILNALEDCYYLNVDVINMSLGTTGGFSSAALLLDDEGQMMNEVYENIRNKGISLIAAASNDFSAGYGSVFGTNLASNPDSGTIGSPSTFSGAMSVGSINGQLAPYIVANATLSGSTATGGSVIYFDESRNEDSEAYSFLDDMLGEVGETGSKQSETFKYVVVPGYGAPGDYTSTIKNQLQNKESYAGVIAVIKRGISSFKDKIEIAKRNGADGVIVYNNVSGLVRMSLGDMQEHVPAISVSLDAGLILTEGNRRTGTITLNRDYNAGPFMNDYSSWGVTPDLKLKPDITSHGGEITSTVAGGYAEMSGTSMASPNLAGFTALLKGYLKNNHTELWQTTADADKNAFNLTKLTNNIMMSTATTVYDQYNLPYSPRKQGAGLATLKNVFGTKAYLYTDESDGMCEDGRPKAELGEDEDKKGEYSITFYVHNFGGEQLNFKTNSIFMTETLGADGKAVAERAYLFDSKASWKVGGAAVAEGGTVSVPSGESVKVEAVLTLSAAEKRYLNSTFKNGMFVEGFLQLVSSDESQCSLTFPFLAFYGDWESAPMLDYDCYQIAEFEKDSSLKDENRPQATIWASQAYTYYWNDRYATPLGSFVYLQDEAKEHTSEYVYTEKEHSAISRFNDYYGEGSAENYLTTTGIKALYAGLLRNAEVVTYTLINEDTGEVIPDENGNTVREIYRVPKAYANGGSNVPAQVLLQLKTDDLALPANGKYQMDFSFYFKYEDYEKGEGTSDTFTMSFYVDYEAPVLVDSRIRFQDLKDENNNITQKIFLDLDIFDNHYPQAVILCYSERDEINDVNDLKLATEYVTPVLNPKKNSITTVSIEITDIYDEYKDRFYVEIDDYALNHNVYAIDTNYSSSSVAPSSFTFKDGEEITIQKNTATKLTIENLGGANLSNFIWRSSNSRVVKVKNGEIFGAEVGTAYITATGAGGASQRIRVNVTDGSANVRLNSVSFGTMLNSDDAPVKASGLVGVNPGQKISLSIVPDPWYYPIENLEFTWASDDETIATVDQNGNVEVIFEGDKIKTVTISATAKNSSSISAEVSLSVQDPYMVSNGTLTRYRGVGGELKDNVVIGGQTYNNVRVLTIPKDKTITVIGEEAFKDCDTIEVVVIPKMVATIEQNAFDNCKNLKKICFISEEEIIPADSSLNLIYRYAFNDCPSLVTVDLSNCKIITLDVYAFAGCAALKEVIKMEAIGTAYDGAFRGCTSLESANISKLHVSGSGIFAGCTSLSEVITSAETALGSYMFQGCTAIEVITLSNPTIPASAFYGCTKLESVTLGGNINTIGANAFAGCSALSDFDCGGYKIGKIGNYAFQNCTSLTPSAAMFEAELGRDVFQNVSSAAGAVYSTDGKTLIKAPRTVDTSFSLGAEVTAIAPYAFSGSTLATGVTTVDISGVTEIGEGAFYGLTGLASVTLNENVTEIPANAFRGCSNLTSITIPAKVKKIGNNAFNGCSKLATLIFADGSQLTEIGNNAFFGIAVETITLPDGVTHIGESAFAGNSTLKTANISSVTSMGEGVFMSCPALETVTFGENATTTGAYTFWAVDRFTGQPATSSLKNVTLSNNITALGDGVFAYNSVLESVDLKNITTIGEEAFYGCTSLKTVTGLEDVTLIGINAFTNCSALTSVDISAATAIYYRAFFNCTSLATATFGSVLEGIGDEAFAETALTSVTIPASCGYVGVSAFSGVRGLRSYAVADGNKNYFTDDGVLYRYITADKYELVSYPTGKTAANDADGVSTYTVKEGTVTILAFAFYGVSMNASGTATTQLNTVVLPHTLKTIGNGAFLNTGINTYVFESIAAPVLLEGVAERNTFTSDSPYSFFYNNFKDYIAYYVARKPGDTPAEASTLTIKRPTNGTGYDNYIYKSYFGNEILLGEMPENAARELKALIEGLESVDTVSGWTTANTSLATVRDCADRVKQAHYLYNTLSSNQNQLDFVGQENIDKLFAVEEALKPVKKAFGIAPSIERIGVAESSTHKSEYKEGEKFKLDGLKILVTYDDYSQEIIDAVGNFVLSEDYDRGLWDTDTAIVLVGQGTYLGMSLSVRVTITEGKAGGGGGLSTTNIIIIVVVVVVAALAAAAAVTFILLKKKGVIGGKKSPEDSSPETEEENSEENKQNLQDGEKGTDE